MGGAGPMHAHLTFEQRPLVDGDARRLDVRAQLCGRQQAHRRGGEHVVRQRAADHDVATAHLAVHARAGRDGHLRLPGHAAFDRSFHDQVVLAESGPATRVPGPITVRGMEFANAITV